MPLALNAKHTCACGMPTRTLPASGLHDPAEGQFAPEWSFLDKASNINMKMISYRSERAPATDMSSRTTVVPTDRPAPLTVLYSTCALDSGHTMRGAKPLGDAYTTGAAPLSLGIQYGSCCNHASPINPLRSNLFRANKELHRTESLHVYLCQRLHASAEMVASLQLREDSCLLRFTNSQSHSYPHGCI